MTLEAVINDHYQELNENDLFILQYITNHQASILNLSISDLASLVSSSTASVLRLTKKLGFSGYSEFKYYLKQNLAHNEMAENKDPALYSIDTVRFDIDQTMKEFQNAKYLPKLLSVIDQVDTIYALCVGYGQRLMLKEFARCMLEYKKNLVIISGYNEFEKLSHDMTENDLILIVSQIGEIAELRNALKTLKVHGSKTVSITSLSNNELAKATMWNFYYQNSNIDPETKMNQSSFLTLHLLLHLLFNSYVAHRNEDQ